MQDTVEQERSAWVAAVVCRTNTVQYDGSAHLGHIICIDCEAAQAEEGAIGWKRSPAYKEIAKETEEKKRLDCIYIGGINCD